jgi:N-acetylmuramoyl-L-alanine amidase
MRNFGSRRGRAVATSALLIALSAAGAAPSASQSPQGPPSAQSAETLYNGMLAREAEVRRDLDLAPQLRAQPPGEASAALLRRVRATVTAYEEVVRRYPRSGYSDNALWQAAVLSADAFWQFGDIRDRAAALRLFDRVKAEFPTSSLVAQVAGHTNRLNGAAAPPGRDAPATLKALRREVLPDTLRITLELEREAMFYEERLEGPPRVFVDLRNTRATDALKDSTINFDDDLVAKARIGRQADNRTRVVFDLRQAGRYSVYSLYNPYRVVIDFERTKDTKEAKESAAAKDETTAKVTKDAANAKDTKTSVTAAPRVVVPPSPPTTPAADPPARAVTNGAGGFSLSRQLGLGIARVVIDPGHGGHDPGAQVRGLNEAELVLDIALRLERLLAREPGVQVVMTRRTNTYVALEERTAVANRSGADLFLSIHANASPNPKARGFETYFLNFAPNPEAEALAARENAGSAKTMGNLPDIVKAIALNNKIDESRDFASMVQASLNDRIPRADRNARNLGVKQAPFMVLIGATMPSVLAEVSFLTNRDEATLLKSQAFRQQIAEALFAGVMRYGNSLKKPAVLRSGF